MKGIAKTGFGLADAGMNATIGRANKVLLHGEAISLPPGLVGLPKNLSALPANILEKLPEIIARLGFHCDAPKSPHPEELVADHCQVSLFAWEWSRLSGKKSSAIIAILPLALMHRLQASNQNPPQLLAQPCRAVPLPSIHHLLPVPCTLHQACTAFAANSQDSDHRMGCGTSFICVAVQAKARVKGSSEPQGFDHTGPCS